MNFIALAPVLAQLVGLTIPATVGGVSTTAVLGVVQTALPIAEEVFEAVKPGLGKNASSWLTAIHGAFHSNGATWLQQSLNALNPAAAVKVDGQIGPETVAALEAWLDSELGITAGGNLGSVVNKLVSKLQPATVATTATVNTSATTAAK